MSKKLHIANGLSLPLDTVTQSLAILAKRRAGKSYTARRIAEELAGAKLQTVIVDPKGDWWGIRSAADGKSPGLPITILGGAHGDLPLEVGSGEVIAKLAVFECVSVLLDLSQFRKNEVARFMSDFMEAFYRLKAAEEYRSPVMLIVDEADAIAPQKPFKGEERMLGAIEDIVRRGGQRGIGCLLITQRSAVLNKNVLTQVQLLVAMRTIAPQDLDAMNAWIDVHGTVEQRKILMGSLPSLPTGDAWFWSPGWPDEEGIFKRVHVGAISTFDSGATPKPGEKRIEPKHLAQVDLEALRRQMAETIEKAKADDPRLLRQQIAELKKQLAQKQPAAAAPAKEIPAERLKKEFDRGARAERIRIHHEVRESLYALRDALRKIFNPPSLVSAPILIEFADKAIDQFSKSAPVPAMAVAATAPPAPSGGIRQPPAIRASLPPKAMKSGEASSTLPEGEKTILRAIAQYPDGAARDQLTVLTGYKRSTRDAYIQRLCSRGYVAVNGTGVFASQEGIEALGSDYEPLPTRAELQDYWLNRLPSGEAKILRILIERHGEDVERSVFDSLTEFARSSRDAYIQRLASRGLVIAGRRVVRASKDLFE